MRFEWVRAAKLLVYPIKMYYEQAKPLAYFKNLPKACGSSGGEPFSCFFLLALVRARSACNINTIADAGGGTNAMGVSKNVRA